jgi:hypothetical protein
MQNKLMKEGGPNGFQELRVEFPSVVTDPRERARAYSSPRSRQSLDLRTSNSRGQQIFDRKMAFRQSDDMSEGGNRKFVPRYSQPL